MVITSERMENAAARFPNVNILSKQSACTFTTKLFAFQDLDNKIRHSRELIKDFVQKSLPIVLACELLASYSLSM
jgi:hypothetical protein